MTDTVINKKYFSLNRNNIIHKGISGYAVYDLQSGIIVSLTPEKGDVVFRADQGNELNDIVKQLSIPQSQVLEVLSEFEKNGKGDFYDSRVYIEKSKFGYPSNIDFSLTQPVLIQILNIELPGQCKLNCGFCTQLKMNACWCCARSEQKSDTESLKKFLTEFLHIDINNIVIHGGDPFSDIEQLFSIIKFCRDSGYKHPIFVITNGTLITNETITLMLKFNVEPIIPLLPETTKITSQRLEPYVFKIARKMFEEGLNVSFTIVEPFLGKKNRDLLLAINSFGVRRLYKSVILEKQADRIYSFPENGSLYYKPNIHTNPAIYSYFQRYSICLYGRQAISVNGDILPCPLMRDRVLGNINTPNIIKDIFSELRHMRYWKLALEHIHGCDHCEFRYGCEDCRAVEIFLTGKIDGKTLCIRGKNLDE